MDKLITPLILGIFSSIVATTIIEYYSDLSKGTLFIIATIILIIFYLSYYLIHFLRKSTKLEKEIKTISSQIEENEKRLQGDPTEIKFGKGRIMREEANILVVDDNFEVLDKISKILDGCKIVRAFSIGNYLIANQFDIIIADIVNAGVLGSNKDSNSNSDNILRDIKANYPYKYIIAMSSDPSIAARIQGVDAFFSKTLDNSFDKDELIRKINTALEKLNDSESRISKAKK